MQASAKRRIHADPEHLSQIRKQVLAVSEWIAAAAAITKSDIQKAVRPKHQLAAFVIGERLVDDEQDAFAVGIGLVGVGCRGLVLGDHGFEAAKVARVIDVELVIAAVVGVKRQPQKSLLLSVEVHQALDVEKIPGL